MSTEVRHRRGTTAQHAVFTGALGEVTVDTDKKTAVVHDGVTVGGIPLAREDTKNDGAFGYQQDVKTNDYAVVVGDIGKMLVANKATAINFALGTAAALTSKFVAGFKNIGAGTLTITPNGTEQIDGVNAAISVPTGASLILKGDGTSFRTFVSNGDVTASAIHNAASKAALADSDEIGVIDTAASNVLKKSTLSNLITSIFKTARTIANAQFDAASFKLFNAAGTPRAAKFDNTAMTADRTLTLQDRDMTLGMVLVSKGNIPANPAVDLPGLTGARRYVLLLSAFSTNGTSVPLVQLKAGGVAETSGYSGGVASAAPSTAAVNLSAGFAISGNSPVAANYAHHVKIEMILQDGNTWEAFVTGGYSHAAAGITGGGSKTLAGVLDGIRLTTAGGSDVPDAGTYTLYAEY